MSKNYINTVGKKIVIDVGLDIHDATIMKMKIKKPDDTLVEWIALLEGLTAITYTTVSGDWDQAGRYLVQAYVETPTLISLGETTSFEVYNTFK